MVVRMMHNHTCICIINASRQAGGDARAPGTEGSDATLMRQGQKLFFGISKAGYELPSSWALRFGERLCKRFVSQSGLTYL
jgi:hypothetical protein